MPDRCLDILPQGTRNNAPHIVSVDAVFGSQVHDFRTRRVLRAKGFDVFSSELSGTGADGGAQPCVVNIRQPAHKARRYFLSVLPRHRVGQRDVGQGHTTAHGFKDVAHVIVTQLGVALIAGLLLPCSPTAVAGLVVPIHIYAVDRVALRPGAHINDKGVNAVSPPLAHLNAAAAVVLEAGASGIRAALSDAQPRIEQRVELVISEVLHAESLKQRFTLAKQKAGNTSNTRATRSMLLLLRSYETRNATQQTTRSLLRCCAVAGSE